MTKIFGTVRSQIVVTLYPGMATEVYSRFSVTVLLSLTVETYQCRQNNSMITIKIVISVGSFGSF